MVVSSLLHRHTSSDCWRPWDLGKVATPALDPIVDDKLGGATPRLRPPLTRLVRCGPGLRVFRFGFVPVLMCFIFITYSNMLFSFILIFILYIVASTVGTRHISTRYLFRYFSVIRKGEYGLVGTVDTDVGIVINSTINYPISTF
jgi:hypothetical protein